MNNNMLNQIITSLGGDAVDIQSFSLIYEFLNANPSVLSGGQRKIEWDGESEEIVRYYCQKYLAARRVKLVPSNPTTMPDPAVSHILHISYGYPEDRLDKIKVEHQHSMAAENAVGSLLEKYIASKLEPLGWVWCAGEFIKAIDFIKLENDKWITLQVKNRDNSENSSSSAIRKGTEITKWFRTFSKTGETNWPAFPDAQAKTLLSEEGFMQFITQYLSK